MKMRTVHNRIERREFIYPLAEVLRILKADAARFGGKPVSATLESWDIDIETDDDTGAVKFVTLLQSFEYLSPVIDQPPAVESYTDPKETTDGT